MAEAILTEALTKDYGRVRALDGLDLRVERGEILGFLGPNGAGKSTTIRLLLDLIRPTAGRASVMGRDCRRDSRAARALMGYLPGDVRLPGHLRGRDLLARLAALRPRPVDPGRVGGLARRLDLDLGARIDGLSKGNRQKLAVLAALLDRPPVLVLDEPTSGLDPIRQHEVLGILSEEAAAGAAVFFSSHVLSEVEHVCERVAVLRAGRLMAVESVAALTGRARQRFEVGFAGPPPALRAPGVTELSRRGEVLVVEVTGEADALVKALAPYRVRSLRSLQVGLEDVILDLYRHRLP